VATCEEARKVLVGLGALDLSDLSAASAYADTTDSQARHALALGHVDDAQKLEEEVYAVAEKVLAQRPGDLRSLANRYFATDMLGTLAYRRHDDAVAADYAQRSAEAGEAYMLFQPSDLNAWAYWTRGLDSVAEYQLGRGQVSQALATRRALVALARDKRRPSSLAPIISFQWLRLAVLERQAGLTAASERSLRAGLAATGEAAEQFAPDDARRIISAAAEPAWRSRMQLIDGNARAALASASGVIDRVGQIRIQQGDTNGARARDSTLRSQFTVGAAAALQLGQYAQAEALARRRLAVPADPTTDTDPVEESSAARTVIAHAVAMQGREAEALAVLAPALAYYRKEQQANAQGSWFRRDFAYALYVSALAHGTDPAHRAQRGAELAEAATLLGGASAEAKNLASMRQVAALIAAARAS
jgi:hypothetical protein